MDLEDNFASFPLSEYLKYSVTLVNLLRGFDEIADYLFNNETFIQEFLSNSNTALYLVNRLGHKVSW